MTEIPVLGDTRLPLRTQLIRFLLTGGLSAVVDFGTYQLMLHFGLYIHLAKAISFVLGTTTAYVLNRAVDLSSRRRRQTVRLGVRALRAHVRSPARGQRTGTHVRAGELLGYDDRLRHRTGNGHCDHFIVQRTVIFRTS